MKEEKREKNLFFEVLLLYKQTLFPKTFFMSFRQFVQSFFWLYKLSLFSFFLMMSFRQLIQSFIGFISSLCYFVGNGRVQLFLLNFFAVFRNSMNVIANAKKLFKFFVIDGKGGGYPRDTLKWAKGGTHLRAID
jgi:hypothetical protein